MKPILLAEDREDDAVLFKMACEQCHITNPLKVFEDGADIIQYLESDRSQCPLPAILFLDLKMQRMGGLEVLQYLQKKFRHDFPTIILTGMEDLEQMAAAYQLGVHSFLLKPLQAADFRAFIEKFKGVETSGPPC
jgi:CheY-like chemotaxis protein